MRYSLLNFLRFAVIVLAILVACPQKARAYVDPGSGAMIYQMAYALFLAVAFSLRRLLTRLRGPRKD